MKKTWLILILALVGLLAAFSLAAMREATEEAEAPVSKETEECIECHRVVTPGIVEEWLTSHHSYGTPGESMKKPPLKREVSSQTVPESLRPVAVGCFECHSLNQEQHEDNFEHFDYRINVVVSPNDCGICHAEEREQFVPSKKAHAHDNLAKNPVFHKLVETITSLKEVREGDVVQGESSDVAKWESCYGCHGTRVEFQGLQSVETDLGPIEVPQLSNWPNQGVGRVNPDGSQGACTACHPRHSFSIAVARKADTCSQCHLEPDLPAWNVYRESKHGNIFTSKQDEWNWENIPWVLGEDFTAPTCAVCHNSLLVNTEGEVIAERSHDFGSRLWVRIFGLIYSHPQPKTGKTYTINNKHGLALPTTFTGELAADFLLDEAAQNERKERMSTVCQACHGQTWTKGWFVKMDQTVQEADKMVLAATELMLDAWDKGIANQTNPFDETLEQKWIAQWLMYANSVRYASAMAGPDYAAFKNGWWSLTKNLQDMKESIWLKMVLKSLYER